MKTILYGRLLLFMLCGGEQRIASNAIKLDISGTKIVVTLGRVATFLGKFKLNGLISTQRGRTTLVWVQSSPTVGTAQIASMTATSLLHKKVPFKKST
jgi:hypothetical protein